LKPFQNFQIWYTYLPVGNTVLCEAVNTRGEMRTEIDIRHKA